MLIHMSEWEYDIYTSWTDNIVDTILIFYIFIDVDRWRLILERVFLCILSLDYQDMILRDILIFIEYTHKSMYEYTEKYRIERCEYPYIAYDESRNFFFEDKPRT